MILPQLENKQQIMPNNVETQHNILVNVVCLLETYVLLYLHRDFTCIRENLNAMKHSTKLCIL